MSHQAINSTTSSRADDTDAKDVDRFSRTFLNLCAEEDVCRIPEFVVGRAGVETAASESECSVTAVCESEGTLKAIDLRGPSVEQSLLRAFGRCLSLFPTITVLRVVSCGLRAEDVYLLALILEETKVLKELKLNGNSLGDMCYSCLLQLDTRLQHLSLCSCGIEDLGVAYIAAALEHKDNPVQSLLRLNLSSNRISCKGAELLANALRTNRTLVSLSLCGNWITDTGAIALAEVFQKFLLRPNECADRRRKYFAQNLRTLEGESCGSSEKCLAHPYLTEVQRESGCLFCRGNFTLVHLDLSFNSIGLPGLLAFHESVLYQESALQPSEKGLLMLSFQGNSIPEDRPELADMLRIFDGRLSSHRMNNKHQPSS